MSLTRDDLDRMAARGCDMPGCDHADHEEIYLHARCHLRAGTRVSYRRGSGLLRIACRQCRQEIATVLVCRPCVVPAGDDPHTFDPEDFASGT